jgi:hypothetical protein
MGREMSSIVDKNKLKVEKIKVCVVIIIEIQSNRLVGKMRRLLNS